MILQFGTSRFLQAHVDLFAWEARMAGQSPPEITIVQVSEDPVRARRLSAFADPAGFPVVLRGLKDGAAMESRVQVRSVARGLAARRDWEALQAAFVEEATHVVSNTGDSGFDIPSEDRTAGLEGRMPQSFCGLLVALLHRRWRAGRPGVTFLPCELVARNGTTLRERVSGLAADHRLEPAFQAWLKETCIWADTLVDRIVSEPLEPAGAVAEPYALWAIERQPGLTLPFSHPAIVLTYDLEPYERLKLHILNLGHTWLAARWRSEGAPLGATVLEAVSDPDTAAALRRLYDEEVQPGFDARGLGKAAKDYIATTLERFANPFLRHQIADIFTNHRAKTEKRIASFVRWVDASGVAVDMPELRKLCACGTDVPT